MGGAILRRRLAHDPAKRPGEVGVVVEAAGDGDGGDRIVGFGEPAAGGLDSHPEEVLPGRRLDQPTEQPVKMTRRHPGDPCQRVTRKVLAVALVHPLDDAGHRLHAAGPFPQLLDAPRDAGHADHAAGTVVKRHLRRHDESRRPLPGRCALDPIDDRPTGAHHLGIVAGILVGPAATEKVAVGAANRVCFACHAAELAPQAVQGGESSPAVLREEGNVGKEREELHEVATGDPRPEGLLKSG